MNNDIHYNYNKLADLDYMLTLSGLSESKRIEIERQRYNVLNRIEYLERKEREASSNYNDSNASNKQELSYLMLILSVPIFLAVYYLSYYMFELILKYTV